MTDITQESYNKFTELPNLPYNCISYLIDNDDYIWKLLKYNDRDAWKMPNLTRSEKASLIYSGEPDNSLFRVFMDTGQDNTLTKEVTDIRISVVEALPVNYVYGYITMGFEVYSHYKVNHLSNYQTRVDVIIQRLLEVFNGAEIGGLGRLYFDYKASGGRTKINITGQLPFKGKVMVMCNWLSG